MARQFRPHLPSAMVGGMAALSALAMAGAAIIVNRQAARAEKQNPPLGAFVEANGVRLHYIERGHGRPVVFLHGNGMMVEDWLISGMLDAAGEPYRAVAFDRPGFGHSERPRGISWTAAAQAKLLAHAFVKLGIDRPIIVGHSLGTMVALSLALNHPDQIGGLVLVAGYYYPTLRADVALVAPSAAPILGDVLCYTFSPLAGEAMAPRMIRKMFAPNVVPQRFQDQFPVELMLRPSQISASTKDGTHMIPDAAGMSPRYGTITCPTAILAGDGDKIVELDQARKLHSAISGSSIDIFAGAGHMLHYVDPARVMRAIDLVHAKIGGVEEPPFRQERIA